MGRFIASVALSLSVVSVAMSGFCLYKMDRLEQSQSLQRLSAEPVPSNVVNANANPMSPPSANSTVPPDTLPMTTATPSKSEVEESKPAAPITIMGKLPKNQGDIQVLSVKRIADPYTKQRNIVNVQLRLKKALTSRDDMGVDFRYIYMGQATSRDPDTSQVFKLWNGKDNNGKSETQYSDVVNLGRIAPGSSADVYAWFSVPQHVKKINVYLPGCSALEGLPIQN